MEAVLGTMTFGPQVEKEDARSILQEFIDAGHSEVDAAYVYNSGDTERILGDILDASRVKIATKVNPRISGKLDASAVKKQLSESLKRMNLSSVDLLYFHFPDPNTPVLNALEEVQRAFEAGKIKSFGLSNYPAWEVVKIYHLCEQHGWIKPSVYQGMYNGLSRNIEQELFPAIRDLDIRFYAYNPLAGGLLSGKYKDFENDPEIGRFTFRPNYKDRYWRASFFSAISELQKVCDGSEIKLHEAAFRWLVHHSEMKTAHGDAIILGLSKIEHLRSNLEVLKKGPLPEQVVRTFEEAWVNTQSECPSYFRYIPSKSK